VLNDPQKSTTFGEIFIPHPVTRRLILPYRVSEKESRYNLIDPQLRKAEWNLTDRTQVGLEIPVAPDVIARSGAERATTKQSHQGGQGKAKGEIASPQQRALGLVMTSEVEGITDYCLYRSNGEGACNRRVFLQRKKVEMADLYEEPFTSFGLNAVDKLFSAAEIEELVFLVRKLAA